MGTYDQVHFKKSDVKRRYYKEYQTSNEIAKAYGCSNVTVLNYIRSQGWSVRQRRAAQVRNRFDKEFSEKCRKLYEKGASFGKLGARFKCHFREIQNLAKRDSWYLTKSQWISKFGKQNGMYRYGVESASFKAKAKRLEGYKVLGVGSGLVRYEITAISRSMAKLYKVSGCGKSLDHVYSFNDFYYNPKELERPCTIKELCHPVNLRWLTVEENSSKGAKSDWTLSSLRKAIRLFNARFGNPYKHPAIMYMNLKNNLLRRTEECLRINAKRLKAL